MPARKGKKPAASEVADQTKEENSPPSKKRAVSEEKEEVDEIENESEVVSEDEGSKPKRGRGRPKKTVSDVPKSPKRPRGRAQKQKLESKDEDIDETEEKTTKQKKGRPRKAVKQDSSDAAETNNSGKAKANGKNQIQLNVEHCKS